MIYEATFDNQILVAQLRGSVQKSKKSLFFKILNLPKEKFSFSSLAK